ncbi:hypothetical protein RRG08_044837 [Elysia crispata]|uniref:Uncharacterized protein n=1 Tax=Elysia crispata TaxID=231223 RepID=A0AAE0ZXJ0_9GAST|nr:hypothetical protein RRG08_044837 [Elysia crispata]
MCSRSVYLANSGRVSLQNGGSKVISFLSSHSNSSKKEKSSLETEGSSRRKRSAGYFICLSQANSHGNIL